MRCSCSALKENKAPGAIFKANISKQRDAVNKGGITDGGVCSDMLGDKNLPDIDSKALRVQPVMCE